MDCLCYHNTHHTEQWHPAVLLAIDAQLLSSPYTWKPQKFGRVSGQFKKKFKEDHQKQLTCHHPYVFGNKQKQIPFFI